VEDLAYHGRVPPGFFESVTDEDREAVEQALEMAGVQHLRDSEVGQLSGGQKQLAWIAMVLAQDTDVLLLDEPTTFLDLHNQFKVLETVRQLNDRTGVTVAVVLHDVAQAARFADYLIALRDGQLYDWGRRRTSSPNSCSPTSSALRPPSSTSPSYRCCRGGALPDDRN